MDALSTEMEKMIIESAVKQDGGPFKSAWEAAVEKGRRALAAAARPKTPLQDQRTPTKSFTWGSTMGSPLKGILGSSPAAKSAPVNGVPRVNGGGRMSPPPPPVLNLDRPGYVRARSVSLL